MRELIGDEFTLENLKSKYKEIMSMNVEPSTKTTFLNVEIDPYGNMTDKTTGNYVEDYDSISASQYYEELAAAKVAEDTSSAEQ